MHTEEKKEGAKLKKDNLVSRRTRYHPLKQQEFLYLCILIFIINFFDLVPASCTHGYISFHEIEITCNLIDLNDTSSDAYFQIIVNQLHFHSLAFIAMAYCTQQLTFVIFVTSSKGIENVCEQSDER